MSADHPAVYGSRIAGAASLLPAVLSATAGAVDAIGFLALGGLFTAHITGNVVILAAHYVIGGFSEIGPLLSVPVFVAVLGAVTLAAGAMGKAGHGSRRAILVLHAALLAGCLGLGAGFGPFTDPDSPLAVLVGMLAVAAMATQNAMVKLALPGAPSTAVMTTNVTLLTVDLATAAGGWGEPDELARARQRAGVTFPCVLGFLVGCVAGAVLEVRFGLGALALPVALAVTAVPLGELWGRDTLAAGKGRHDMSTSQTSGPGDGQPRKTRVVILGGGFGGVSTARRLEQLCKRRRDVEIVLVSRDNFLMMTPLLFEVCSGALDARHCSFPIRAFLRTTRFVEATVEGIDPERRVVRLTAGEESVELAYDQLVIALGGMTNRKMIPGSEHAFTFKTLADAFLLRNHVIERFERADVEPDPARKRRQLTFVTIGGGLVGVELFGELTAFADGIAPLYKHVSRDDARFVLLQGGARLMPEIDPKLADYGAGVLRKRRGADIRTGVHARAIEPGKVHLPNETIEAETIILAAGIVPSPVVAALPVEKDRHGRIVVDGAMRCKSHPEVWALGDCAAVPAPDGQPYPGLAQHAMREAKVLARNIAGVLDGRPPQPFVYTTLGMMGSLGHGKAFGQLLGVRVRGFLAWFVRRTYYLMQMPGWGRRLRIMIDWTFALLFRPDVVKVSLDREEVELLRDAAGAGAGGNGAGSDGRPLTTGTKV